MRLRGRDKTAVWGQLVFAEENGREPTKEFRFELASQKITLYEEGSEKVLQLDEMGVAQQ